MKRRKLPWYNGETKGLQGSELGLWVWAVIVAALGFPATDPVATGGPVGPRLSISPAHIELGRLERGSRSSFKFDITNTGDSNLVIHSVSTTCGCLSTTKKWKDVVLQPREGRVVDFEILAESNKQGRSNKMIWLKSDDPTNPVSRVSVSYVIKPVYRLTAHPARLDFETVGPNSPATLGLRVVSPYPERLKVDSIRCTDPCITVLPVASSVLGDIVSYSVVVPAQLAPGAFSGSIDFETTIGPLTVPFEGYTAGALEFLPRRMILPPAKAGKPTTASLVVYSRTGEAFHVLRVVPERATIAVEYHRQKAAAHTLHIYFSPDEQMRGVGSTSLEVVTDAFGARRADCRYFVLD